MNVVIVGGGKVGFYLVGTLKDHGHNVWVIEKDKQIAAKCANALDIPVICDDGSSLEALEEANCAEADAFIAVTGADEDNLIACQIAKKCFNVPRTVARVNNPRNTGIMKVLGVDIPVSTTDSIARIIEREVDTAAIRQLMSLNRGQASLVELQLPPHYKLHGKTLMEIALPQESIMVSITRDGELIIPRGTSRLLSGDKLILICKDSALHNISKILELEESQVKRGE